MSMTGPQLAKHLGKDPATIRKWPQKGCPVIRRGAKGPGRGALFDLATVEAWRGRATAPAGLSIDDVMQQIAVALWQCLEEDHADIRAGISQDDAATVFVILWERCCKNFGVSFKFDAKPKPIRALMARIVD
jgi:hypothetical protein